MKYISIDQNRFKLIVTNVVRYDFQNNQIIRNDRKFSAWPTRLRLDVSMEHVFHCTREFTKYVNSAIYVHVIRDRTGFSINLFNNLREI